MAAPAPQTQPSTTERVFSFVSNEYAQKGIAPTIDEIAEACFCSKNTAWRHVQRLWSAGRLVQKQGWWGNKYIPADVPPPADLDPMVERAYKAGLLRGWQFGCQLNESAYRRARETGFNPHLSAEEA